MAPPSDTPVNSTTPAPPRISGPLSLLTRFGERQPLLVLLGIMMLGLGARYPLLFDRDIWLDEVYVHVMVAGPLNELGDRVRSEDRFPPLFHILCRAVTAVSDDPKAIRLISLVAGLGTIPLGWILGRQLHGSTTGWALAVFVALAPPYVFYSREARPFALGLFLLFAFFTALVSVYRKPTRQAIGIASTVTAAAVLTQYANIVVIAVTLGLAVIGTVATQLRWTRRLSGLLVVFGTWLAVTVYVYLMFAAPQIAIRGTGTGQFDRNFYDIRDYSSTGQFAVSQTAELLNYGILGGNLGPKWLLLTSLCVVTTLVIAVATNRTRLGLFGMVTGLAVVLVFLLLAGIGKHPYGGIRHCLVVTPLVLATMAGGLGVGTSRLARIVSECFFVLIVGLMAYGVVRVIPGENRYEFSQILPALADRTTPSDVLYVTGRYDSVAVGHLVSGNLTTSFRVLHDAMKANGDAVDLPSYPLRVYAWDLTDAPKQPDSRRDLPVLFTPTGRVWVTDTFRSEPPPRPVRQGFAFQIVDEIKAPGCRATCWQSVANNERDRK